ncbi:MAG: subunit of tubulin prefoldin [Thelocarpon impressellum]|nr:MAG: subunit of tubulin prefoldin [Thelocarpon impressellum]
MASSGTTGQQQKQPQQQSQTVDLASLSAPQLASVKKQLDDELEHLTGSFAKLRAAQAKFRDCLASIATGVSPKVAGRRILVPLTTSLYAPGTLADAEHVIVDVGTGFYVEKVRAPADITRPPSLTRPLRAQTTKDATAFYAAKVDDLGANLKDLEQIVQGKSNNLRVVEDVLRQKVLSGNAAAEKSAAAA